MKYSMSEYLTAQFYAWEKRGRGWTQFEVPVHLEPEFVPFFGHFPPMTKASTDTGRRPRFFPALQESLGLFKKPTSNAITEESLLELEEEIYPVTAYPYENPESISELQIVFDKETRVVFENIEQLLLMLSKAEGILGFEVFGTGKKISIQFVCTDKGSDIKPFINAYAPEVVINETTSNLADSINTSYPIATFDLGLEDEFLRPLKVWNKFDPDPLSGCIAILDSLKEGEFGMIQVLFQGAINPWAESMYRSVSDGSGGSFFEDAPEMLPLTKEKISNPLFATVIRTIGQGKTNEKTAAISEQLARSLISFYRTGSNRLIPLSGSLSFDVDDIIWKRSKRTGMILNSNELASIVHIPDRSVVSSKLRQYTGKTKKAPKEVQNHSFELGTNIHLGQETPVTLSTQHRLRHMHLIGATGTGKSSLLHKLIIQDIIQGTGLTVLDPHGDLIDKVIRYIPEERLKDVVLVDPSDSEYPIGLNLLSAHSEGEKIVLSSDLVALFKRFATSWGDQMTSVLANAINAILESKEGGTLIDLRRFLVEPVFRDQFLENVSDPNIHYYWNNEFLLLRKNTVSPILTRLDTFLRPRIIRNMMAQKEGLDFGDILNDKKILLVKLAQGLIGEENSYLLGTLFVAKLHQAAQARQSLSSEDRNPFYFYIDEFQNFITPSMSSILSGARKYGLGLILAHQDLDQLVRQDGELANSVLSNPAIRVCFRCGDKDASKLENGFSYFDSTDLQSLGIGQAVVRVEQKNHDFNLSFDLLPKVDEEIANERKDLVVENSRSKHAIHQSQVEEILKDALEIKIPTSERKSKEKKTKEEKPVIDITTSISSELKEKVDPRTNIEKEAKEFINREVKQRQQREHRYIQEFIKKIAEARSFKAIIEEPINDGTGKVDVSLHRDDFKIACEISVTNTVEYEVQNIQKCFTAGYSLVFMISDNTKHLAAIREQAVLGIDKLLHNRLYFVSKGDFVVQLDLLLAQKERPTETRKKGYRVKLNYTGSSDSRGQKKALKDIIVSSLKNKRK